ncbi:basic leucine zipper transcriptional factor ATF-like 3 isoform X2 [Mastomys coucha]|uniref:basic leucine zipper transcriptional factor ATF-like 3 isoform X2 n=1 Tax=Mastomys coucha TaxID=35658 RepID=UPI001262317F|nr:basic leucine zipper transcriptional factor ATF-like 3 isoform X2 [Mastomys coucha]
MLPRATHCMLGVTFLVLSLEQPDAVGKTDSMYPCLLVQPKACRSGYCSRSWEPSKKQEHESLEQENSVLRREIAKLKEELRHLSEALKEHEKMCPLLLCPMNFVQLRPDPVASCLPR